MDIVLDHGTQFVVLESFLELDQSNGLTSATCATPRDLFGIERGLEGSGQAFQRLILFAESSLRRALQEYVIHYHGERNHQGKENTFLFPLPLQPVCSGQGSVQCQERLGGLLKYYHRKAA
jgi:hypothetical protein